MKTLTNFTQKIALTWLKNIDRSLIIYNMLRDYSLPVRLLFYAALSGFTTFGMIFAASFINIHTAPEPFVWLGKLLYWGVIVGMGLIISLESVYKLDVAQIFRDGAKQKQDIKAQKLQFWRLRNMPIYARILIYILFYMSLSLIIQTSAQGAFVHLFLNAPNTPDTQMHINSFIAEYDSFLKWFTFIYIISGLTLDYFVSQKRAAKKVEAVSDENL